MSHILDQILRASRPNVSGGKLDERGTPPQPRSTAAPVAVGGRIIELTRRLEEQRVLLAVAGIELQRWEAAEAARDAGVEREARYHTFGGVSFAGAPMAQHWCDLILWEAILNTNPHLRGIVEIGTWQGGFSRWLYAQTVARSIGFRTFDVEVPDSRPPGFVQLDVWAHPERIEEAINACPPTLLFCDGGNKPRELAEFGPMVGPEGLVIVHDWGTETLPSDVPEGLEEVYGDFCDELGSISRVFKVRQ